MDRLLCSLLIIIFAVCVISCNPPKKYETGDLAIVPKPVSVKVNEGVLNWNGAGVLIAESEAEKEVAAIFTEYLAAEKWQVNPSASSESQKITLEISNDDSMKPEGYQLSVNDNGINIKANTEAGLFYGVQTFLQLIPEEGTEIPYVEIEDYPRFTYRGMHLDVGRHMFPVSFVKKYIDLLARHKLNKFHWHLTEDQGWRIEIKKYPKLQEVGAWRKETAIGRAGTKQRDTVKFDGKPYGGFYTQEEIKEVVDYAAARYVTVIPEIELPGHALSALASYPTLGCTGGPYETATAWGIFDDVYCAGKEETFVFLQDVLDEVIALFPGEYIHIGGDECWKNKWEKCPHCQKRIKTEKLKDEHELQSYFIQRIEKYLNSKGKKIIGWDEILEGGLAPHATVMSWRGEEGGIKAASQGHDVIMTPEDWLYLDHAQDTTGDEPVLIRGYSPVIDVYRYEPIPEALAEDKHKHVLGAQCNVWTEYMKTPEQVEYMAYPRAVALAEVVWTQKDQRDFSDFSQRMQKHLKRLDKLGVSYGKHMLSSPVAADGGK